MKKIWLPALFLVALAPPVRCQGTLDTLLAVIAGNNKQIRADLQQIEAKKREFKTNLAPYNPRVVYDYLNGSPAEAGNQIEFSITQSLDFPTAYGARRELSQELTRQADFQALSAIQDVLLEAVRTGIELVYYNRLQAHLSQRRLSTEKWLLDFRTRLEKGEGNVMDVNKARLQLLEINAEFQQNHSAINQLNQKLTELNGGIPVILQDTVYPASEAPASFEALFEEAISSDPARRFLEADRQIGSRLVALQRSLALPKLEAGYRYQTILGQTFNGVSVGLTLPLWENNNKVEAQRENLAYAELNIERYTTANQFSLRRSYEKFANLKISLDEYRSVFGTINTLNLLDKSLALGHISTIEYFLEVRYHYDALRYFLALERDYHQTLAELLKHRLIDDI